MNARGSWAVVAPAVVLPVLVGSRPYLGIRELAFRQVVLGLLFARGIAQLASSTRVLLAR